MRDKGVYWLIGAGIFLLAAVSAYGYSASTFNTLTSMDQGVQGQLAEIDNQLQRRADLIPNLVETVKGYAAHERQILEALANARARLAGARDIQDRLHASAELNSVLARLLVIVENYPNLKADATFARLMDELAGTENRLAVARRRYNQAVEGYNVTLKRFPTRFLASVYGFQERPFFEAPADARQAPKVKF